MPSRDNALVRRSSARGFLSRPLTSLGLITGTSGNNIATTSSDSPPVSPYPPPSAYDIPSTAAFAIPTQPRSVPTPHPYSLSSSPRPLSFLSSSPRSHSSQIERFPGSPLALVGSPSAAIAKALNMASLKIFGSPADGILLRRSSTRKPITRSAQVNDPAEEQVLADLEDIAQKALVLSDFADSKIVQILPPTPQTSSPTSLGTPSYFSHVAAREQSNSTSSNPFSPVPAPSPPPMRRTSSSSSGADRPTFVMASSARAEILAAEAMVLYLKALAFLGKGIEKARRHWANRANDQAASSDFNEGTSFRRFNRWYSY
jgi:serine/threonine-protein kinase ULK/ATG1